MLNTCIQELPLKKTKEKKGILHASLVTSGDENQRVGSGAWSAAPCEALGLLAVLVEAQQVPVTSPRWGVSPAERLGPGPSARSVFLQSALCPESDALTGCTGAHGDTLLSCAAVTTALFWNISLTPKRSLTPLVPSPPLSLTTRNPL